MNEPMTIDPAPPANPGMDYYALKREGTRWVQALSGRVWTDYNEHDPGVTTLEQLCYALTELSYRAQLPMEDLLTRRDGEIDYRRQALYPPIEILPGNPVTTDDVRKLIVDRVKELANAWVEPLPYGRPGEVGGLYRILAYVAEADPRCGAERVSAVAQQVEKVYAAHRELCEDVKEVVVLEPIVAQVFARVSVDETLAPEALLAEVYFRLGNFLAPELARRPLDALLAEGLPPDAIFNGPLLRHGFIADGELQPKAERFT
ncbi:MAG: hypothetical protein KDD47_26680, partial [Acidobacteria bacterium]|nr:hypothetical protein [Acidobacteriota bacterium]